MSSHYEIPVVASLSVVLFLLAATVVASRIWTGDKAGKGGRVEAM